MKDFRKLQVREKAYQSSQMIQIKRMLVIFIQRLKADRGWLSAKECHD